MASLKKKLTVYGKEVTTGRNSDTPKKGYAGKEVTTGRNSDTPMVYWLRIES
jgi:hypothetical protein